MQLIRCPNCGSLPHSRFKPTTESNGRSDLDLHKVTVFVGSRSSVIIRLNGRPASAGEIMAGMRLCQGRFQLREPRLKLWHRTIIHR